MFSQIHCHALEKNYFAHSFLFVFLTVKYKLRTHSNKNSIFYSRTYWIKMFGPENFSVLGFLCSIHFASWKGVWVGEKSYFKFRFHQKLLKSFTWLLILFLYKHMNYIFNLSERSNKILMVHILFMKIIFAFISY